jgi:hypothetical protein
MPPAYIADAFGRPGSYALDLIKSNAFGSEFIEWYYRRERKVSHGKYTFGGSATRRTRFMRSRPALVRKATFFALALIVWASFGTSRAIPEKPEPVWEVDLTKFGYQAPESLPTSRRHDLSLWSNARGLTFTAPNVLVAYFETRDEKTELSSRDELQPTDPYHLHALFLDANHGEVLAQGDWPVRPSIPCYFFAARDGKFVVADGEELSLYSPDRLLITRLKIPWLHEGPFKSWSAQISPDGETLLVQHGVVQGGANAVQLDLYGVAQLSLLKTWTKLKYKAWALWSRQLAWSEGADVYLQTIDSGPKVFAHAEGGWCGPPSFVNEDALFVGCGSRQIIVSTSGTILSEIELGSVAVAMRGAISSRNGTTFAIATFVPGLFDSPTARRMTVKVINIGNAKPILMVDIPPKPGWGGIALSPKGDLLAVGASQFVKVYRVPQL